MTNRDQRGEQASNVRRKESAKLQVWGVERNGRDSGNGKIDFVVREE
jgi:hypothetical protein